MRRTLRGGATLLVTALLASLFTVLAPQAQAVIAPGELGSFQNDGDQDDGAVGVPIDWQTVQTDPLITQWALIHDDNDEDTDDSSQINGAKEQDPSEWGCATTEAPPKDDIFRVYLASQITAAKQLLHIGYVRDKEVGDTDINIEFNQLSAEFSCPDDTDGRVRSAGDLLISFTFAGNTDLTSVIEMFSWDPTAEADNAADLPPDSSDQNAGDGHWDRLAAPVAAGAANTTEIIDHFFEGDTLDERTFGELTLDLGSLFQEGLLDCPGFGFATVHSRASHEFTSDLKDVLPEVPFNLSDCGSLDLKKVNELGQPMAGVTFGLYDQETGIEGGLAQLPTVPPIDLTCVTTALGICSFPRVPPGDYLIGEVNTPVGYTSDPRLPMPVAVTSFANNDLSDEEAEWFVNTRLPLDIELTKTSAATALVGDTLTYRFTVTNTGSVDLVNIELVDAMCAADTITRVDDGDGDDGLEIADIDSAVDGVQREVWSYTCTHVVTAADPDPLPNTATVTGNDMDGRATEDTATWVVDIIAAEVLGVTLVRPAALPLPATLPRTGAPVRTLTTIGLVLLLFGFALYRMRRPNPLT